MKKIRYGVIVLCLLLGSVTFSEAQVSIGIGLPNLSIGINLPVFPELVRVPGYPVYYAPQMTDNYFFYDGMYWVYQDDNWYASSWYNGPWGIVDPQVVPLYILRIPVRYYRQPPAYFRGWQPNAPPRWNQHWGRDWEHQRRGWDKWKRSSAPAPAPLPVYQRNYNGDRYPRAEQQRALRNQSYRYQPRERAVREHFKQQVERRDAPDQRGRQDAAPVRSQRQPEPQRAQPADRRGNDAQRPAQEHTPSQQRSPAVQEQRQQPRTQEPQREQRAPRVQDPEQRSQGREERSQDRGASQEQNRGRGQGQEREDDRGRGRER